MKRSLGLSLVAALAVAPGLSGCDDGSAVLTPPAFSVGPSSRYHLEIQGDGRAIALRRGDEPLLTLDADAFQAGVVDSLDDSASYDPYAFEGREGEAGITFRTPVAFTATKRAPAGVETDFPDATHVDLDYGDGLGADVEIFFADPGSFVFTIRPRPSAEGARAIAVLRVRARTSGDPKEGFYGLGEWEDSVDHRGKLRAMQIEPDLEIESANNEAHVPVPFLIGTHGWAMFVRSSRVGAFDVARKDPAAIEATFAVTPCGGTKGMPDKLVMTLHGADAAIDLVKHAGGVRLPPPWALGPWIWRNENRDQAEVLEDVATIRRLDLATSGIWIDRPYASAVNSFDFDPKKFTDPPAMIADVRAAGLRFALWSTPYLEQATGDLRMQADAKGFFPPQSGIPLNKWSRPIDFTQEPASAFWVDLVSRYTKAGVDGFKLDYGEDVVASLGLVRSKWQFADGTDERTMHSDFVRRYHAVYERALPEEHFLLCRAAQWGESAGCIIWPGDMDATFTRHRERFTPPGGQEVVGVGGLPATIVMGLSLSASGFPFFGSDTGGYRHSPPDEELFLRWVEQTSLSTVMQVGDSSSQPPWEFTPENGRSMTTVDVYRTYARLHMRLFPYEWSYAQRMQVDGRPIQRPLGLAHPEMGIHPSDTYLFGDELLVAPVVTRGERRRDVVVPAGSWIDWWDGTPYASDGHAPISIDAPLDKLPLLLRDGAIVPMLRPTIDTLSAADDPAVDSFARDPGLLWVRIAPGRPRRFELWDRTSVERANDGSFLVTSGDVFATGFVLETNATSAPTEVTREEYGGAKTTLARRPTLAALDTATEGWAWEPARRGTLWVKLRSGKARVTAR